jgi:hypothetical protein
MGDQHAEEILRGFPQSWHGGEEVGGVFLRIEGKAEINEETPALGLQFDATATDLVGSAVNANAH